MKEKKVGVEIVLGKNCTLRRETFEDSNGGVWK